MTPAEKAFRKLREQWFSHELRDESHEREWESKLTSFLRDRHNEAMKATYDEDTEAILRGEDRSIAPKCWADLYR